jgi:hypothetical protein
VKSSIECDERVSVSKVKIKLSLSLIKNYSMKVYGGVDLQLHAFLNSESSDHFLLAKKKTHDTRSLGPLAAP